MKKKNTLTPKSRKLSDSFDSDSQVDLMLDQSNKTCLAAYYVDYEDYSGMCQGKVAFPRLKAIREQLNKRTNVDEDIDLFGFQFWASLGPLKNSLSNLPTQHFPPWTTALGNLCNTECVLVL